MNRRERLEEIRKRHEEEQRKRRFFVRLEETDYFYKIGLSVEQAMTELMKIRRRLLLAC